MMKKNLLLLLLSLGLFVFNGCSSDDDEVEATMTCDDFITKECTAPGKVTFIVTVPSGTPAGPIYAVGNFMTKNGASEDWNPGNDAFKVKTNPDDADCKCIALTIAKDDEYKFTRGNWETVEKGADCEEVNGGNRVHDGSSRVEITITNWRDVDKCD